MNFLINYTYL